MFEWETQYLSENYYQGVFALSLDCVGLCWLGDRGRVETGRKKRRNMLLGACWIRHDSKTILGRKLLVEEVICLARV